MLPAEHGQIVFNTIILIIATSLKIRKLPEIVTYGLFVLMVFCIGLTQNTLFIMQNARTNPKLVSVSFELNMAACQCSALYVPILAAMDEPAPTIAFWIICTAIIIVSCCLDKKEQQVQETDLEHMCFDDFPTPETTKQISNLIFDNRLVQDMFIEE